MSEAHTVGEEVDVVGEIIGHEYRATVNQLRSLCGTALLTEVVMADDEQLAVHRASGEAGSNEVFVLTHRIIDENAHLVEKFTISTSPPDLLGISHFALADLERVENKLIDLGLEGGHADEIADLQAQRTSYRDKSDNEFAPKNEVDDETKLDFAPQIAELTQQAKIAKMTQEAEDFHDQKKSA
jgi:hypothetical protein